MNKRRLAVIEKSIKGKYQMRISRHTFKMLFIRGFVVASIGCSLYTLVTGKTGLTIFETIKEVLQVGLLGGFLIAWLCTVLRDVSSNYLHKHLETENSYLEFEEEEIHRMLSQGKVTREEVKMYLTLRRKQVKDGNTSTCNREDEYLQEE